MSSKKIKSNERNRSNETGDIKFGVSNKCLLLKKKYKQTSNCKFDDDAAKRCKYNKANMSIQNEAADYTSHVETKKHKECFHADTMKSLRAKWKLLNKIKQWRARDQYMSKYAKLQKCLKIFNDKTSHGPIYVCTICM